MNLAGVLLSRKKVAEARAILPSAVATERRLLQKDDRMLADGIRRMAELCAAERDWVMAEALYREALGVYEASIGPAHPDIAPVLTAWAGTMKRRHALAEEVRSVEARAKSITARG